MRITSNSKRKDLKYVKFDYSGPDGLALKIKADFEELDEDGWTNRIVTEFRDGTYGFADKNSEYLTFLPEASIYPLEELALDDIPLYEISKEEFEAVWKKATRSHGMM